MTRHFARLLLIPLLLAACDADGITGAEKEHLLRRLNAAEARWDREGPTSYAYTLNRACFCGFEGPVRISVENDVVVDVRVIATDEVLPAESWQWYPSIRELFAILDDAIELPAGKVTVTFDATLGYPKEAYIDWYSNAIDDEIGYYASDILGAFTLARSGR